MPRWFWQREDRSEKDDRAAQAPAPEEPLPEAPAPERHAPAPAADDPPVVFHHSPGFVPYVPADSVPPPPDAPPAPGGPAAFGSAHVEELAPFEPAAFEWSPFEEPAPAEEPAPVAEPAPFEEPAPVAEQPPTEPVAAVNPPPRVRSLSRRECRAHSGRTEIAIPRGELGRAPGLEPPPPSPTPADDPQDPQHHPSEQETPMSQIDQSIQDLLSIDGATGAAIVDIASGMALGTGGNPGFDLDVAAAGNSNVVRAKLSTMSDIGFAGRIEDIMISLDSQYHLVNVLNSSETEGLFIYLVLDRAKSNLALARHKANRIAASVSV